MTQKNLNYIWKGVQVYFNHAKAITEETFDFYIWNKYFLTLKPYSILSPLKYLRCILLKVLKFPRTENFQEIEKDERKRN